MARQVCKNARGWILLLLYHHIFKGMGWLPSWGSSGDPQKTPASNATQDGGYEAPGRLSRAKCWDSRDAFYQCLDRNNILDAIKDKDAADRACGNESENFEQNCASSWVSDPPTLFPS